MTVTATTVQKISNRMIDNRVHRVLLGDALNLMLTPSYVLDNLSSSEYASSNEYIRAQRDGKVWNDCSAYKPRCPQSIFEVTRKQSAVPGNIE